MSKKKDAEIQTEEPSVEEAVVYQQKEEVIVNRETLDRVVIKNLSDGPRQFHLRDGTVVGCLPNEQSKPFLRKHLTVFLRKLEKEGKVSIIPLGGA